MVLLHAHCSNSIDKILALLSLVSGLYHFTEPWGICKQLPSHNVLSEQCPRGVYSKLVPSGDMLLLLDV